MTCFALRTVVERTFDADRTAVRSQPSSVSSLRRSESFIPPTAFSTLPLTLSILPSACSLESPVTLPAASFILPFAWSPIPLMRSLSILCSFWGAQEENGQPARLFRAMVWMGVQHQRLSYCGWG